MNSTSKHRWKFVRIGGVDQVIIRSGADIVRLEELDQKLWVALACPTTLVEFDARTLELLDLNKDGRIRAPEIIAVSRWVRDVYLDPENLLRGGDSISLGWINRQSPAGEMLLEGAERLAGELGKTDQTLTLAEVQSALQNFLLKPLNGDGVVTPDSAADPSVRKVIDEILSTVGGVPDRSGKAGVNAAKLDAFYTEAAALVQWFDKGDAKVLPFGQDTVSAASALNKVRGKIDDFFTRCRLAEFDSDATEALDQAEVEFRKMSGSELTGAAEEIARLPLASAAASRALPLETRLNPAWRAAMSAFRTEAVDRILGSRTELRAEDWAQLQDTLAPCSGWLAEKPQTPVEKLGFARLRELLGSDARAQIAALIAQDLAEEKLHQEFQGLEKLTRVQRDLCRLLNNFVSFSDFYRREGAIFQAGTLYLDARSCELCVHVADPAKHAALAALARTFLAYCDCTRQGEKMTIAAAITAGDSDHLMVGRNGVFYDRKGRDWDATITKIIDNPISLGQAFWSPYKKFIRLIEEQVAKRAAAADTAAEAKLGTTATHVVGLQAPKPPEKKMDVGTVAAIGVALGSIGTFLGVMFAKFLDLGWWIPLGLLGLIAAISGPAVVIAWLKLRQRNLGPILDANGWAVNGRMKVNVPFGGALSRRAKIPPNSERQLTDPFTETHVWRNRLLLAGAILLLTALLWAFGLLDSVLPEGARLHWFAPAPPP